MSEAEQLRQFHANTPVWAPKDRAVLLQAADALDCLQAALTEAKELADSEGTRAVEYLRRARKADGEVEALRSLLSELRVWFSTDTMIGKAHIAKIDAALAAIPERTEA